MVKRVWKDRFSKALTLLNSKRVRDNFGSRPYIAVLTEVCRRCSENSGAILELGHHHFQISHSLFIGHPTILCYIACATYSVVKWTAGTNVHKRSNLGGFSAMLLKSCIVLLCGQVSCGAYVEKGESAFVIRRGMTLMMKALRYFEMSESILSATQRIAQDGGVIINPGLQNSYPSCFVFDFFVVVLNSSLPEFVYL
jgi:hypothetical protein